MTDLRMLMWNIDAKIYELKEEIKEQQANRKGGDLTDAIVSIGIVEGLQKGVVKFTKLKLELLEMNGYGVSDEFLIKMAYWEVMR